MSATVNFIDRETGSPGLLVVRPHESGVTLGFGIEADGDLDITLDREDARKIAHAILAATEPT